MRSRCLGRSLPSYPYLALKALLPPPHRPTFTLCSLLPNFLWDPEPHTRNALIISTGLVNHSSVGTLNPHTAAAVRSKYTSEEAAVSAYHHGLWPRSENALDLAALSAAAIARRARCRARSFDQLLPQPPCETLLLR